MIYTDEFIKSDRLENSLDIKKNLVLETISGSRARHISDFNSDIDIIAIFIDRWQDFNPITCDIILGFDDFKRFEHQEVKGPNKKIIILPSGVDCEGEWFSLTRFFYLAGIKGSPPLIESLFVQNEFVTFSTNIGKRLIDNRNLFLSTKTFQAFKGHSTGQLERIRKAHLSKKSDNIARQKYIDLFGYDVKMASHLLLWLDEMEQITTLNSIDLTRNKEEAKIMRQGKWGTFDKLEKYFNSKIKSLEELFLKSSLLQPQTKELHNLLKRCIYEFYDVIR